MRPSGARSATPMAFWPRIRTPSRSACPPYAKRAMLGRSSPAVSARRAAGPGSGPRRALEALLEALHLTGGVHDRLLAGVERMAVGADVHAQFGPRGADAEDGVAGAADDLRL